MENAFGAEAFIESITALGTRRKSTYGGLTVWDVGVESERFAKALSRQVESGRYVFEPARPYRVRFDGRERRVFQSTVLDSIAERVVGRWLQRELEPSFSESLWSYRAGRSSVGALHAFGRFVRDYVSKTPDPTDRGLFVLRRDVARFGTSIPTGPDSRLWTLLEEQVLGSQRDVGLGLLRQLILRRYVDEEGNPRTLAAGAPTGSPVQPAVNNLYLTPLDSALGSLPGHYMRFGDDILFATSERRVAVEARGVADSVVGDLGLTWNTGKTRDLFFNGAGRPEPDCDPEAGLGAPFEGSAFAEVLGYEITFQGTIRLPRRKLRALLASVQQRLQRTARMAVGLSFEARAEEVVGVARAALDPRHPLGVEGNEALFHVDDREQLAQVDHLVCLAIAQLCSGRSGPRSFREMPPRRIRELGLPSLVQSRNRGRK